MALGPGAMLSQYRLAETIGRGGMGVLWRAEDTLLGREVAIKLLPDALAHDRERLARFKREARLLATLTHPNIALIHALQEIDGLYYLVLELVAGETLAERISRGPMPVVEALRVGLQIAGALEAAHRRGIVHRDLKPGNIKLSPEGQVKVLDFGLAKTLRQPTTESDLARSPTSILGETRTGVILGTTPYMSPEQVRGKPVDERTDIWSFGCVLYEMLTGARAFAGETGSDVIARVIAHEPDWKALPGPVPAPVRGLLRRCLQKEADRRPRSFRDLRPDIERALATQAPGADDPAGGSPVGARRFRAVAWGTIGALLIAGGLASWWMAAAPAPPAPAARFELGLPPGAVLPQGAGRQAHNALAVSPDGSRLVFAAERDGRTQLHLRPLGRLRSEPIPGTEGGANPFFSPDGRWLGFFSDGKLKKMPVAGGTVVDLCDARWVLGASWGADGTIVFATTAWGLRRVPENGGQSEPLTAPDATKGDLVHHSPQILPDGKQVLFTIWSGTQLDQRVAVQSIDGGEARLILESAGPAYHVPSGHLMFLREGRMNAVRFDMGRLRVDGTPVPILEDLGIAFFLQPVQAAFSNSGVLVYAPEAAMRSDRVLVWVDRDGRSVPLSSMRRMFLEPRLSPDGRQLALNILSPRFGMDVWIHDLERATLTQLTTEGRSAWPLWSPDGRRVVFTSNRAGQWDLYWRLADGSGPTERLTSREHAHVPTSWSPDGRTLAFAEENPATGSDLWVLPLDGDRAPRPLLRTPFNEQAARFSPDGRWVAYASDESGRMEIHVCRYPACEDRRQVSAGGGTDPLWARDGRELFYRHDDQVLAAAVRHDDPIAFAAPRLLFEGRYDRSATYGDYDVSPDGRRFLMIQNAPVEGPVHLNVVLNWFQELDRLAP